MLHDLTSEAPEQRVREALQVSFTAWNAVVFADVLNDHRHLDEIRRLTADKPEVAPAHGTTDRPQTHALCR